MLALNRSAIIVRPKLPFLEWLHAADPTSVTLTLADLGVEPTIYLVPECADGEQERAARQTVFRTIFEEPARWLVAGSDDVAAVQVLWNVQSVVRLPVPLNVARLGARAAPRGGLLNRT